MNRFSAALAITAWLYATQAIAQTTTELQKYQFCSQAFFYEDLAWIEKNYGGAPDAKSPGQATKNHQEIEECANSIRTTPPKLNQLTLLERVISQHPNSDIWRILYFSQKLEAWRDHSLQMQWGEKRRAMREIDNWVQEHSVKRYRYYASWHVSRLRAIRMLGWPVDTTLAAGIEAVKAFPESRELVFEATSALAPHSSSQNTSEASWANSLATAAASAVPSKRRNAVFTRTVLATTDWFLDVRRRPIQMPYLSWNKLQLGFEQDWKINADIAVANTYAHLACLQGDGIVFRKVMSRLGNHADDNHWRLGTTSYIDKTGELQRCVSLLGK